MLGALGVGLVACDGTVSIVGRRPDASDLTDVPQNDLGTMDVADASGDGPTDATMDATKDVADASDASNDVTTDASDGAADVVDAGPPSPTRAVVSCGTVCQRPTDAIADGLGRTVYFTAFTDMGEPAVYRATIPAAGMPPAMPTLVISGNGMEFPAGITISNDNATLYVVDPVADRGTDATMLGIGAIFAIPAAGGSARVLDIDIGLIHPQAVTITSDGDGLLVSGQQRDSMGDIRRGIFRVARTGGGLPTVVTTSLASPSGVSQGPTPMNNIVALDLRATGPNVGKALTVPTSGAPTDFAVDIVGNHPAGIALALDGRAALISGSSLAGTGGLLTWVNSTGMAMSPPEYSTGMVTPVGLHRARTVDIWTIADEAANDTGQIFVFTTPR
jgi:hypothetical protein